MALTGAGAVVHAALLRMSPQPALEAMLPELREPGVSQVGVRLQVQVIIVEPGHIRRLQLYGDSASRLPLVAVSHIVPVSPAVTAEGEEKGRDRRGYIRGVIYRED